MLSYTFFITSLIVVLVPGTGVIYTISTGISKGKIKSVIAAIGCTIGIIPHLILGIACLSILQGMTSTFFTVVKYLGVTYLFFLGINMIRAKDSMNINNNVMMSSNVKTMAEGIFINLLNPKLTIFFISFLPQFIQNNHESYALQGIVLGLIFMLITLVIFIIYGLLAGTFSSFITKSPNRLIRMQRIFGAMFIYFAIQLALSQI